MWKKKFWNIHLFKFIKLITKLDTKCKVEFWNYCLYVARAVSEMLKIFNFCQIPLPSLVNVNVYCLAWAHRVKSVLNPYCSMIKYKKVGNKACKKSRLLIILKVIEMKVATIEQCISLRKKKIKLRKLVHSQLEQRE